MDWWIWLLIGLMLFLAELVTPGGFYIIFFGVGALIVGVLAGLEAAGPPWFQYVLFSVVSVVALWLFREKLLQLTRPASSEGVDNLVGETAVSLEDIPVNGIGKAEMRGTSWSARNIGDKPLARGQRSRVERVEGLTIFIRAESI
jgi:membrane protein implicated in regulation of membrane protease activity